MTRTLLSLGTALALAACSSTPPAAAPAAAAPKVEVTWLGQAAFKIVSPGGKVIVTDPWLRMNPLTPPEFKKLESFGKIDVLLVTHGHATTSPTRRRWRRCTTCRCAGPATC